MMGNILMDEREIHHRIFNIPQSAIQKNGRKINYYEFISSLENEDCNRALRRILPSVDMKRIAEIINETPFISDLQKEFYKKMLAARKERILDYSIKRLHKREKGRSMEQ